MKFRVKHLVLTGLLLLPLVLAHYGKPALAVDQCLGVTPEVSEVPNSSTEITIAGAYSGVNSFSDITAVRIFCTILYSKDFTAISDAGNGSIKVTVQNISLTPSGNCWRYDMPQNSYRQLFVVGPDGKNSFCEGRLAIAKPPSSVKPCHITISPDPPKAAQGYTYHITDLEDKTNVSYRVRKNYTNGQSQALTQNKITPKADGTYDGNAPGEDNGTKMKLVVVNDYNPIQPETVCETPEFTIGQKGTKDKGPPLEMQQLCSFIQDSGKKQECISCVGGAAPNGPSAESVSNAAPSVGGIWTAIGCIRYSSPAEFVSTFLGFGIGIAGGIAFLLILWGGFLILTSGSNPEQLNEGRELVVAAVAGLIFIIFSLFILRFIGVNVLGIPGFK